MEKKKKLLEKYLDKKRNQLKRDDLFAQIASLSKNTRSDLDVSLFKPKVKKSKKTRKVDDSFEKHLFEEEKRDFESNERSCDRIDDDELLNIKENTNNSLPDEGVFLSHEDQENDQFAKCRDNQTQTAKCESLDADDCNGSIDNFFQDLPKLTDNEGEIALHTNTTNEQLVEVTIDYSDVLMNQNLKRYETCNRLPEIQERRKKLDIFYEQSDIISTIKRNLVTYIQGRTGCGKTTQIPQFLLESGFADQGRIGITQPRRISTISIASRINVELNEDICAYKIKYEDNVCERTKIKVMTDGVLLREIIGDFLLKEYDIIILDEIHERSTNIDLLLGLLSKIVKLRFESGHILRLVLMSATAAFEDFKILFPQLSQVNLKTKQFKVDVFYEDQTVNDYVSAISKKITMLLDSERHASRRKKSEASKHFELPPEVSNDPSSGILVFLPSKDDIYDLKKRIEETRQGVVVLPLHAGLSKEEQSRIYQDYDERKIILATNIAETSITIDGIVFVIDSGRAKFKTRQGNTTSYKVDFISKSSAKQRTGRAGRTGPGICFRMYSGDTFEQFDDHSVPQLMMEPLDGLLLFLKRLGVKNVMNFPFLTVPPESLIKESIISLQGLGLLTSEGSITKMGKVVSKYPFEPRIARILCMPDIDDIFFELSIVVSILASDFEIKKTDSTSDLFRNTKSDLIVKLKAYMHYRRSNKNPAIAKKLGITSTVFEEIEKMVLHVLKISGRKEIRPRYDLSDVQIDRICKVLFYSFCENIAVKNGDSYLYKGNRLAISNDSINPGDDDIIFEHIVCGAHRTFAKNITVIDKRWF